MRTAERLYSDLLAELRRSERAVGRACARDRIETETTGNAVHDYSTIEQFRLALTRALDSVSRAVW